MPDANQQTENFSLSTETSPSLDREVLLRKKADLEEQYKALRESWQFALAEEEILPQIVALEEELQEEKETVPPKSREELQEEKAKREEEYAKLKESWQFIEAEKVLIQVEALQQELEQATEDAKEKKLNLPEIDEIITIKAQPELKIATRPLEEKELAHNTEAVDDLLSDTDKKTLTSRIARDFYDNLTRKYLITQATLKEKGEKIKEETIIPIIKKFQKNFWRIALAGGIIIAAQGFTVDSDGIIYYDYTHVLKKSNQTIDRESTINKILLYLQEAPWATPSELDDYIERVFDTKQRSDGTGVDQAPEASEEMNPFSVSGTDTLEITRAIKLQEADSLKALEQKEIENKEVQRINENINNVISTLGGKNKHYQKTDVPHLWLGELYHDNIDGLHGRSVIDLSDGVKVTYQPRNSQGEKRKNLNGVALVSDYLYDMDMTDGYQHTHAQNALEQLRTAVKNGDFTHVQKFAQVKVPLENEPGNYILKVKPVTELDMEDFDKSNVYRQSWATLSDFDMRNNPATGEPQIRLTNYSEKYQALLFKRQGLPFHSGSGEHNLRIPGGVHNYGKHQNIKNLDLFGAYIGGTVTIISDDGKIARKVTGSLYDILAIALAIQKETGGREVHFLQSDAGSMNVKALANKTGNLEKSQLKITRNQEPWAGSSEILLRDQSR